MSWRTKAAPPEVREAPPELEGLVGAYLGANGAVEWVLARAGLSTWLRFQRGVRYTCGSVSVRLHQGDLRVCVLPVPRLR